MIITLNIGLNVSKNYMPEGVAKMQWQYEYAKDKLAQVLGTPSCIGLARSKTEETVVVQYGDAEAVLKKLFWLARQFNQDCIAYAMQDEGGVFVGGALVGEYAHKWNHGVFDKEYFIEATTKLHYRTGLPL